MPGRRTEESEPSNHTAPERLLWQDFCRNPGNFDVRLVIYGNDGVGDGRIGFPKRRANVSELRMRVEQFRRFRGGRRRL